jgi:adenylate cyclase, class 2
MSRPVSARRNVELKAIDPDPDRSLTVCRALGASDRGVIEQRDTYFAVARGTLKLREASPGRPHLIQYERDDRPQERHSSYRIIEIADADTARDALTAALGIARIVTKRRHLLLWKSVRIHLDQVDDLGRFIELEAVAAPESDLAGEHALVAELRRALDITDDRLCAAGYAGQLGTWAHNRPCAREFLRATRNTTAVGPSSRQYSLPEPRSQPCHRPSPNASPAATNSASSVATPSSPISTACSSTTRPPR